MVGLTAVIPLVYNGQSFEQLNSIRLNGNNGRHTFLPEYHRISASQNPALLIYVRNRTMDKLYRRAGAIP